MHLSDPGDQSVRLRLPTKHRFPKCWLFYASLLANGDGSDSPPTICVTFAWRFLASLHYHFANYSLHHLCPSMLAIPRRVRHYEEQYHHLMLCQILEQQCSPGDQYRKQSLRDLPMK